LLLLLLLLTAAELAQQATSIFSNDHLLPA
jgi:hypothetical protein